MIFLQWFVLLFQPNCTFPKWPLFVILPQNLFMFCLFLDFYYQAYIKKKPPTVAARRSAELQQNGIHKSDSNGKAMNGDYNGKLANGADCTKRNSSKEVSVTS